MTADLVQMARLAELDVLTSRLRDGADDYERHMKALAAEAACAIRKRPARPARAGSGSQAVDARAARRGSGRGRLTPVPPG